MTKEPSTKKKKMTKEEKQAFLASLKPMLSINEICPAIHNQQWDYIVVSVSGGKDSSVLLAWAVRHFPLHKIIAVHAIIDLDWENGTLHSSRFKIKLQNYLSVIKALQEGK